MRAIVLWLGALAAVAVVASLRSTDCECAALEPAVAATAAPAPPAAAELECTDEAGADSERAAAAPLQPPKSRVGRARAAVHALSSGTGGPEWELEARTHAARLDADGIAELARIAGSSAREVPERLAAAEILRHAPGAELPPAALALLRESWGAREHDAELGATSVRALARFGDANDRSGLLDASAVSSGIALVGLSCARGDAAALELAAVARDDKDAKRSEVALAALATIAASAESGLTSGARFECADALGRPFGDGREARRVCALAELDPARLPAR